MCIRDRAQETAQTAGQDKDTFSIYQIKGGDETRDFRFEPYDRLQAAGNVVDRANYEPVSYTHLDVYKRQPLSRPAQEAGILVHNKIHSVEKDNSGVEGAHKSEETAERGLKYGARKIKQGYRSHKLKPYREAAKAEKAAFRANVDFQYHKTLHENPQLTSNPISRFWQKQKIKRQYAKEARNTAKGIKGAAERRCV